MVQIPEYTYDDYEADCEWRERLQHNRELEWERSDEEWERSCEEWQVSTN